MPLPTSWRGHKNKFYFYLIYSLSFVNFFFFVGFSVVVVSIFFFVYSIFPLFFVSFLKSVFICIKFNYYIYEYNISYKIV